jgi:hypothetical protein
MIVGMIYGILFVLAVQPLLRSLLTMELCRSKVSFYTNVAVH